jgi:hypothetical protein
MSLKSHTAPADRFSAKAIGGLSVALVGFAVVMFGALFVPGILRGAAPPEGAPPRALQTTLYLTTYVLPLVMGLVGSGLGWYAMGDIDRARGRIAGDDPAVFAVFTGLLTTLTAVILVFAHVVWPMLVTRWPQISNVAV